MFAVFAVSSNYWKCFIQICCSTVKKKKISQDAIGLQETGLVIACQILHDST
jgi:hypothetical protein